MHTRVRLILAVGLVAALPVAVMVAGGQSKSSTRALEAEGDKERDADNAAIRQSAREFNAVFAKGDARAIAAFWTANGEYLEEGGVELRSRDAIEKAFTESFKNQKPGKVEVEIQAIRFPSRDTAIEEGFLRQIPDGPGLPSSSLYQALHVREDGKWKIANSREWGAVQDRLGDLAFLIGKWEGGAKGQAMSLSFEKDGDNPFILGKFSRKADGKVVAGGTIKIGLDSQRDQIRFLNSPILASLERTSSHSKPSSTATGRRWPSSTRRT